MKHFSCGKILIAVMILLAALCLSVTASAITEQGTCGDNLTWEINYDTQVLTISGTGKMYNYADDDAPWIYRDFTKAIIQDGVTSIGDNAFYLCKKMTSVTIANGVTSFGDYAFYACESLTEISLPTGLTSIGDHAFRYCDNLAAVNIPGGVTSIGESAFEDCYSLTRVTLPDKITSIPKALFEGCTGLTSIKIPKGVTLIDNYAFSGCTGLKGITIPNSVVCIGKGAFYSCTGLTSLTIPGSVTEIESDAFSGCTGLTSVTIPNSITGIYSSTFSNCTGLTSITIPNSVGYISSYAFSGCTGLADIAIPNSVTRIGEGAFYGCDKLKSIAIPESVTYIGEDAFDEETVLRVVKGSYAAKWAANYGYNQKTLTGISGAVITVKDQVYTGKALKPSVTVKLNGKKLTVNKAYTVSFKNNKNIGTATVTITGKGSYFGTAEASFKINPKPVKISSLTASKNRVIAKWSKGSGITGYEIQYGRKSNLSDAETVSVAKGKTSKAITGLKKGKAYYVRIRTYKTVNGQKYYSTWSAAQKITVK